MRRGKPALLAHVQRALGAIRDASSQKRNPCSGNQGGKGDKMISGCMRLRVRSITPASFPTAMFPTITGRPARITQAVNPLA